MNKKALLMPVDAILLTYIAIVTSLIAAFHTRSSHSLGLIAAHLGIAAVILLIAEWDRPSAQRRRLWGKAAEFAHGWYPVPLIFMLYGQLRWVVPLVHPHDFDVALALLDHRVLGVFPTVWLERWSYPLLTEVLQIAYATYYFLPLVLGIALWRRDRARFHMLFFALSLGFAFSYFGYMLVPAIGPRFTPLVLHAQTRSLSGVWLFSRIRDFLDIGEGVTRDCFPSGHTEITLLVLIFAFRFQRKIFWWLLPVGTALIFSTVYLRYHYAVDVVAGAAFATFVALIAEPLYGWLTSSSAKTEAKARSMAGMTSATLTSRSSARAMDVTP